MFYSMFIELMHFEPELFWESFVTVSTHVVTWRFERVFVQLMSLQHQSYLKYHFALWTRMLYEWVLI